VAPAGLQPLTKADISDRKTVERVKKGELARSAFYVPARIRAEAGADEVPDSPSWMPMRVCHVDQAPGYCRLWPVNM
jgi:hypothetical protein